MEVLGYIVPEEYRKNSFISDIHSKYEKTGKLTDKQISAFKDAIDIEDDFLEYDFEVFVSDVNYEDFQLLKAKFKRNRFRYTKTKNICIRAMKSIIYDKPNFYLIDRALGRDQDYNWRR